MTAGQELLVSFFTAATIAVLSMIAIALTTSGRFNAKPKQQGTPYTLRRSLFLILLFAVVVAFSLSLRSFPYPSSAQIRSSLHFVVIARQYNFKLPTLVPANTPVVFDVTSKDVNHGFGIYDPNDTLIAQVQAMPGYVNHLAMDFTLTGRYTIRCLEYCGIDHPNMHGEFEVR